MENQEKYVFLTPNVYYLVILIKSYLEQYLYKEHVHIFKDLH